MPINHPFFISIGLFLNILNLGAQILLADLIRLVIFS